MVTCPADGRQALPSQEWLAHCFFAEQGRVGEQGYAAKSCEVVATAPAGGRVVDVVDRLIMITSLVCDLHTDYTAGPDGELLARCRPEVLPEVVVLAEHEAAEAVPTFHLEDPGSGRAGSACHFTVRTSGSAVVGVELRCSSLVMDRAAIVRAEDLLRRVLSGPPPAPYLAELNQTLVRRRSEVKRWQQEHLDGEPGRPTAISDQVDELAGELRTKTQALATRLARSSFDDESVVVSRLVTAHHRSHELAGWLDALVRRWRCAAPVVVGLALADRLAGHAGAEALALHLVLADRRAGRYDGFTATAYAVPVVVEARQLTGPRAGDVARRISIELARAPYVHGPDLDAALTRYGAPRQIFVNASPRPPFGPLRRSDWTTSKIEHRAGSDLRPAINLKAACATDGAEVELEVSHLFLDVSEVKTLLAELVERVRTWARGDTGPLDTRVAGATTAATTVGLDVDSVPSTLSTGVPRRPPPADRVADLTEVVACATGHRLTDPDLVLAPVLGARGCLATVRALHRQGWSGVGLADVLGGFRLGRLAATGTGLPHRRPLGSAAVAGQSAADESLGPT